MGISIEDTIEKVEALYQSLTGCTPPPSSGTYAPVPPEADLLAHIEAQLSRLATMVTQTAPIQPTWTPPLILWQDANDLVVQMELAGVPQSEIDVSTVGQLIAISGRREFVADPETVWLNEQGFGPFCRTVLLPPHVDAESMRLVMKKGMLQLRFACRDVEAGPQGVKRHN